jgi:hypothetical protein
MTKYEIILKEWIETATHKHISEILALIKQKTFTRDEALIKSLDLTPPPPS